METKPQKSQTQKNPHVMDAKKTHVMDAKPHKLHIGFHLMKVCSKETHK